MKKIILTLTVLFLSVSIYADKVSPERALEVAGKFFNVSAATRSASAVLTMVYDGEDVLTRNFSAPAYYVFNNSLGGFVIVSGDDAVTPILGYSRIGSFDASSIPSNVKWWLDGYHKDIEYVRNIGLSADARIKQKWEMADVLTRGGASSSRLLETPSWGQQQPFYNDCVIDGVQCVTGCGPTAMAEIMYYHRLPAGSFLDTLGAVQSAYDWDNMLMSYNNGWNTRQASAVARLMRDNGMRTDAEYSSSGTGISSIAPYYAFLDYKNADGSYVFNQYLRFVYRDYYDDNSWSQMMYDEIDGGRPVFYSGSYQEGEDLAGHAFVLDGYDGDGMFHFNWGWYGSYNGYFTIDITGGSLPNPPFSLYQSAVIGIEKYSEQPEVKSLVLIGDGFYIYDGTINGDGEAFTPVFTVSNQGTVDFSGSLQIQWIHSDGSVGARHNLEGVEVGAGVFGTMGFSWAPTYTFQFGDQLKLFHNFSDGSTFEPFECGSTTAHNFIPVYDMYVIGVKNGSYSAGEYLEFTLVNSVAEYGSVDWYFDGKSQTSDGVTLTSGDHTIKAVINYSDGTSETLIQEIAVD